MTTKIHKHLQLKIILSYFSKGGSKLEKIEICDFYFKNTYLDTKLQILRRLSELHFSAEDFFIIFRAGLALKVVRTAL